MLPQYLKLARAPNTVKKYEGYYAAWAAWTTIFEEVSPMPATDKHIGLFLISMLQQGKTVHVIASTVYAIKWQHLINGRADPTGTICQYLIVHVKRTARPRRKKKDPLTPAHLHAMYEYIGGKQASLLNLRKFTILLFSFAGFLRFSEAAVLKKGRFEIFPHSHERVHRREQNRRAHPNNQQAKC